MKEALYYQTLENKKVKCCLCPRGCIIEEGQTGFCRVRKNLGGRLYSLVYGKPCSLAIDPIEKKPLFHFEPGSQCLSIATVGCNFSCLFCQNWEISQPKEIFWEKELKPEEVVEIAIEHRVKGISYTYTEPTIFFEFALDIMKEARKKGLYNVWVSNGYTSLEVVREVGKYLDGINIDLKGPEEFYRKYCGNASLEPVLESLRMYKKLGVWVEVTMLIIPGLNDKDDWVKFAFEWISENLGKETPLHLSRFYPNFKMLDIPPTPVEQLIKLREKAMQYLNHVYLGNVWDWKYESSFCPTCNSLLIKREGYITEILSLECKNCGYKPKIIKHRH